MANYICWYAYSGHETEGRIDLEEPKVFSAKDKIEALWKYICYRAMREKRKPFHKNLSEYRKTEYADGGWGMNVVKIDDSEKNRNADDVYFQNFYESNQLHL